MAISSIKWSFPKDADPALPDPDTILQFPATVIKENPVRTVTCAADPDNGIVYYIKRDMPRSFLKKVFRFFNSKSRQEFNAALFLQKMGISVIRYEALGESFSESYLISKEIKNYSNAAQFWYTAPGSDNASGLRGQFITALTDLLSTMNQKNILHPDFHLGNLMCDPEKPQNLLLPDPFGVRKVLFRDVTKYNSVIVTNLAAEISEEEGQSILRTTGADPALWNILLRENRETVNAQWQRRQKQILNGNSKFSRMATIDGITYHIRNTRWFAPAEFIPDHCKKVVMTHDQAKSCWLESFRKEMLYEVKGHPKAWCSTEKESALFYDEV